jgi:hypothetical protein
MKMKQVNTMSILPVNSHRAVYGEDGKLYKEKILAIVAYTLNDNESEEYPLLNFKIINASDLEIGGVSLDCELRPDGAGNFKGIIDENHDWIELSEAELLLHGHTFRK